MNRRRTIVALLLGLAVLFAACGEDNAVGSGVNTDIDEGQSGPRLGESTTTVAPATTAAPVTTAAAAPATTAKPVTTAPPATAAPTTAPPTTAAPTVFEVEITGAGFEPANVRVYANQQVRYTNKDSQTRSVKAGNGSFSSGDLAPGASWVFATSQAGRYDITDGTRPFVVGSIEVIAR
jgi:plastocyanin